MCRRRRATCASTRTSRSARRCSATSARSPSRSTSGDKKAGYQPTDSIGQAGIESTYDTYLRGKNGTAQLTVDSRGRPKGPATLVAQPSPGETLRLTLDIGLQRAAEKALRYGVSLAHTGTRGRACRRRRDRRDGSAERRGARDGVVPDVPAVDLRRPSQRQEARTGARPEDGSAAELSGHQPRDRRDLSAGLDVQAGHRARRHAGRPRAAVRPDPLLARLQGSRPDLPQLDAADRPVHRSADGARDVVRHLLLRARKALLQPSVRPGHPLQGWANRFGLGGLTGHRHQSRGGRA